MALTSPPSSTIVSELIHLLRVLHSNPGLFVYIFYHQLFVFINLFIFSEWSVKLNDFICLKLSLIHEIVAEIPILQMQLVPEDREGNKSFSRKKPCYFTYNFFKTFLKSISYRFGKFH